MVQVEAFWCFQKLMDLMEPNFHKDQNGMHTQLQTIHTLCKVRSWTMSGLGEQKKNPSLPLPSLPFSFRMSNCQSLFSASSSASQDLEPELYDHLEKKDCSNFDICSRLLVIIYKVTPSRHRPPALIISCNRESLGCKTFFGSGRRSGVESEGKTCTCSSPLPSCGSTRLTS